MPHRKQLIATNIDVANHIEQSGTIASAPMVTRFGDGYSTEILKWIDNLGVTEHRGRRRIFRTTIEDALAVIRATPWTLRRKKYRPHTQQNRNFFIVVLDPGGLFKPGAKFPSDQVWGMGRKEMPEPDEFYIGTRLEYYEKNQRVEIYEHTVNGFMKTV